MDVSTWPDWERVGRRFGKRLRDVFDPRPAAPGPSPEEQRAQRLRDASVGLVYFDTLEEVESWNHSDVDPIQQPNQPLLARTAGQIYHGQNTNGPTTKLLLCHDYKGGYHAYESVRPAALNCIGYSCNYLEFVDTFIYFSHKLICVPPATWTNALHRNGVKVLGTVLIEPQTARMDHLLFKKDGVFLFAEQLAEMSDAYGFDGWLFNIEQDAPEASGEWGSKLAVFLSDLRKMMGEQEKILWYDALTLEGDVYYQNGLTPMNHEFAKASNGLFTNYKWTEKKLAESKTFARDIHFPTADVFFGVDLWAQNTDMPGPKRVTYPPEGGGGTNTGLAMSLLSASGFSTAMFAPAWVYEHFPTSAPVGSGLKDEPSIAHQVDESLWTGVPLPDNLLCDCRKGRPHHTKYYRNHPITRYAQQYAAGSSRFFETRFIPAFRPIFDQEQGHQVRFRPSLSSQDPVPNLVPGLARDWHEVNKGAMTRVLYGELNTHPQPSLKILTKVAGCYEASEGHTLACAANLILFNFNMPADDSLAMSITIQQAEHIYNVTSGIKMTFFNFVRRKYYGICHTLLPSLGHGESVVNLPVNENNATLVALGVFMEGEPDTSVPVAILEITSIIIRPKEVVATQYGLQLRDIHIKDRAHGSGAEKRVAWDWETVPGRHGHTWPIGMPWSRTTGPFASFTVRIGDEVAGEAYCLEFPLRNEDIKDSEKWVTISVVGRLFGGGFTDCSSISIPRAELMMAGDNMKR
ncbi:MAG: hypothetical protein Q9184_003756 [Pyrenodesmia sp. 2 TL-2023]